MDTGIKNTMDVILNFVQFVLRYLMANPVIFMVSLILVLIGKKGSIKVGGSGITLGK